MKQHKNLALAGIMIVGGMALPAAVFADDVEVQPGDTLWELVSERYGLGVDYDDIQAVAAANEIADPNLIYVGQTIKMPKKLKDLKPAPAPAPVVAAPAEVERIPGTDWDGDGVIEAEPGEEVEEEAVVYEEPADPPEEDSGYDGDDGGAYWPWDALAECESGGDWHISTGNGYYGGLQFNLSTWQAVGGSGYPHENSMSEQIHRAEILRDQNGGYGAWPACSAQLGL